MFVVQKHHARRMHYDLRLEIGETLKSWAVPEGPCLDPKVRRFAKLVEDHPLEYASFEGRIPDGNYGAGTMIVWDHGTWVTLADDPEEALAAGEIKFRLAGEKLGGGWMLKRLPDDPTNWLLIKERDPAARPLGRVRRAGGGAEQRRSPAARSTRRRPAPRKAAAGARPRRRSPARVARADAGEVEAAARRPRPTRRRRASGWLHEIKYDGYRTLVFVEDGKVRLITRNGHDWTRRYGALAKAFEKLRLQERHPRRRGGGAGPARRHLAQPAGAGARRGRQPRLHLLRLRPALPRRLRP